MELKLFSPSQLQHIEQLEKGCFHLKKQVENANAFGLPVIVAVNKFRYNIELTGGACLHIPVYYYLLFILHILLIL